MFSLIITIVSIVLVGLLAVATIYYGGDSFSQRGPQAQAGTILNNGQQISGAMELRHVDGRGALLSIANLAVETNGQTYLNSVPVPPKGAYVSGEPTAADWVLLNPGSSRSSYMLEKKVQQEVCHWINFKAYGDGDIHEAVDTTKLIQCYGAAAPFTVLFGAGTGTSTPAPSVADDIVVFNSTNVDPSREIIVQPDGGVVSFDDTDGLRTPVASATPTPPSNGNPSNPPSGNPPAVDPSFVPSGPIVTAYDPATGSLSLALPLATSDFTTSATFQNAMTVDGDGQIVSSVMSSYVQARTPITNSTNSFIRLGTLPVQVIDQTSLGLGGLSAFPTLFSADNALALANGVVSETNASNAATYTNSVPGAFAVASDYIGFCSTGQVLAPGQSCDMGYIGSSDFTDYNFLATIFGNALLAPPSGYTIPFTWGDSLQSISSGNTGTITVGAP